MNVYLVFDNSLNLVCQMLNAIDNVHIQFGVCQARIG